MARMAGTQMKCIVLLARGIHHKLTRHSGGKRMNVQRSSERLTRDENATINSITGQNTNRNTSSIVAPPSTIKDGPSTATVQTKKLKTKH
jgi:hypothetical protein